MSARDHSSETHMLALPEGKTVALRFAFGGKDISASLEKPPHLNRKDRRHVCRWLRKIIRRFDDDARGLPLVTVCNGRVESIGGELRGNVALIFL